MMVTAYNTWPEFNGAKAVSFARGNGTEHIFFGDDAAWAMQNTGFEHELLDRTRIIHQKIGGQAILCGTYVDMSERGSRLGEELIDYFMDYAREASGEFGGTSLIHKPILAVQLGRRGLFPVDTDFKVAIQRRSKEEMIQAAGVPDVVVLEDYVEEQSRQRRIKTQAGRHKFYNKVGGPGWGEDPTGRAHVTHLHTKFESIL